MNNINDAGWILSDIFGFALLCVILVIWLLSKRTIHVEQHNIQHNDPHVETAPSGGRGPYPIILGGMVILLAIGLAAYVAISAAQSFITSIDTALNPVSVPAPVMVPTSAPVATTLPVPTLAPVATAVRINLPAQAEHPIEIVPQPDRADATPLLLVGLGLITTGLWSYIAVLFISRKRATQMMGQTVAESREVESIRPAADIDFSNRTAGTQRERDLEAIIPDVVNDMGQW